MASTFVWPEDREGRLKVLGALKGYRARRGRVAEFRRLQVADYLKDNPKSYGDVERLATAFGVNRRTIMRDIDEIRARGRCTHCGQLLPHLEDEV